jgi:hypothetical protein
MAFTGRRSVRAMVHKEVGVVYNTTTNGESVASLSGRHAVMLSCCHAVMRSCGHAVMRSCGHAVMLSCGCENTSRRRNEQVSGFVAERRGSESESDAAP